MIRRCRNVRPLPHPIDVSAGLIARRQSTASSRSPSAASRLTCVIACRVLPVPDRNPPPSFPRARTRPPGLPLHVPTPCSIQGPVQSALPEWFLSNRYAAQAVISLPHRPDVLLSCFVFSYKGIGLKLNTRSSIAKPSRRHQMTAAVFSNGFMPA